MTTRFQPLRRSTAAALVGLFASASVAMAQNETDATDATVPMTMVDTANADGV